MDSKFDEAYANRKMLFGTIPTEELVYSVKKYNISGRALEVGCGDGRDIKFILEQGLYVDGIDISTSAIHTLESRTDLEQYKDRLSCKAVDVLNFMYPVDTYDFIYGITLLDHLSEKQCCEFVKKVMLSLKTGGFALFKVHTSEDSGFTNIGTKSEFSSEIKHYFKEKELIHLFDDYELLLYIKCNELDCDHGAPHIHSFATILIRR
ncbi:MAG: methyltransferase domain-containing protein [Clostridia bacterium]|nr:methyltransferase domain-containing protein [Clostridia bacterium]